MTSRHARARAKARSLEERLGGVTGDPVDLRLFRPQETIARLLTDGLTLAVAEKVGHALFPRLGARVPHAETKITQLRLAL